jgi:adenine-specific DNA-methyltransferase
MATGVPKKNMALTYERVCLEYQNKAPSHEILNRKPSQFDVAHQGTTNKRLYFADNLDVLSTLCHDATVRGKVTLVYIDPPFATQSTFLSRKQETVYLDTLTGAHYVEFLRKRLLFLRELLSEQGAIYVHLDEKMIFEIKLIMDEVFGANNYRNLIVRKKCNPKNYTRKTYGNIADFILFYTKTDDYVWNRPVEPLSVESGREYQYVEPETGRKFMKVPVHAPGKRNGATGQAWRGKLPPPGKHWQYPPEVLNEMDARGEIFWSKNGNPRRKVYLDEHEGVGVQDIWLDFKDAHNQNIRISGYPTEKNPDLLRRIIEASSNPGDLVLDCFSGSGTTLAVADELQRHWIGVDNSIESLKTILSRFETGLQLMGDYVQKKADAASYQYVQTTLFDSLEKEEIEAITNTRQHQPVTDFTVLLESGATLEAKTIVTAWKKRNVMVPVTPGTTV